MVHLEMNLLLVHQGEVEIRLEQVTAELTTANVQSETLS